MPHFGQLEALTGGLFQDGSVYRIHNQLYTVDAVGILQAESSDYIQAETGDNIFVE